MPKKNCRFTPFMGYAMAHLVEVLRYKPEVRGFDY
jgi:hypothetical protein